MADISFGRKQLRNPTPANVGSIIAVFTIIAGIILGWIGTAQFIPAGLSSTIQSILGLLIAIANGVKPFFGVETTQQKVNIEDVTAMESKPDLSSIKAAAPNDENLKNQ